MKRFEEKLLAENKDVSYLDYSAKPSSLFFFLQTLAGRKKTKFVVAEPNDFILEKRLRRGCQKLNAELQVTKSPAFLNTIEENSGYRSTKKRWFLADFYKWQRTRMNLLMDGNQPRGGKWSFDADNRKKVPKAMLEEIPKLVFPKSDSIDEHARDYVKKKFPSGIRKP